MIVSWMTEDLEVVRRVLDGDTESFRLLVSKYSSVVVRMIRNVTGDNDLCEDIGQEVFLTAYMKLETFDPARSSLSTWLLTIARNKSINALRKKKPRLMDSLPENVSVSNPAKDMVQKELFNRLNKELWALPSKQQRALILAEFERLSYERIAQIEGARIGTIKSRINRAKQKLRLALKEFGVNIP
jgi:RNA polymerase sigma factor (sigma-70 family)